MNEIIELIKEDEGYRNYVYDDATGREIVAGTKVIGNPTIGWGRLLTKDHPITQEEAEFLLDNDLKNIYSALNHLFDWFSELDSVRADVVVSMAFNMGVPRFRGFRKTIAAIERRDWKEAAVEILDSKAARDLPGRYRKLANMMRTGVRQR